MTHQYMEIKIKDLEKRIQALKQEPCEDAISREDALMALTGEWTESRAEILPKAIERIHKLPSVQPEPKTEVLDKIRAEIVDLADADAYGDYQQGFNFGLMRAVQIIDKCKESGG